MLKKLQAHRAFGARCARIIEAHRAFGARCARIIEAHRAFGARCARLANNGGILALVLAGGMAVLQPASAQAADFYSRDGRQAQARVERDGNRGRVAERDRDIRDRHVWYGGRRDGGYVYFNNTPAPAYGYQYGYPAYGYPSCPR